MTTFNVKVIMIRCSDQGSSAFEFWSVGVLLSAYVLVYGSLAGSAFLKSLKYPDLLPS